MKKIEEWRGQRKVGIGIVGLTHFGQNETKRSNESPHFYQFLPFLSPSILRFLYILVFSSLCSFSFTLFTYFYSLLYTNCSPSSHKIPLLLRITRYFKFTFHSGSMAIDKSTNFNQQGCCNEYLSIKKFFFFHFYPTWIAYIKFHYLFLFSNKWIQ